MQKFKQSRDNIKKTWILIGGFFLVVIALGYFLSHVYQDRSILYIAIAMAVGGNLFSYFFSAKIALSMSGAKKAKINNPLHEKALKAVDKISMTANIKKPEVYIIEDQAMNAFATGRGPSSASLAFTTGLLNTLDKDEIESVAAHEIAHVKNYDVLIMTIVVTLVGFISIVGDLIIRGSLVSKNKDSNPHPFLLIFGVVFMIVSPIIAKIIQLSISRKREFLADSTGSELTLNPKALASALKKISTQGRKVKKASTSTAHLYIANPFSEDQKTKVDFLERIFSTHPPVKDRIEALEKIAGIR